MTDGVVVVTGDEGRRRGPTRRDASSAAHTQWVVKK